MIQQNNMKLRITNTTPPPPPPSHRRTALTRLSLRALVLPALFACACIFAASAAHAQAACPAGQMRVTNQAGATGCFLDANIKILTDCENSGWIGRETRGVTPAVGLACSIRSRLLRRLVLGGQSAELCVIATTNTSVIDFIPFCTTMYGNPPVFPQAEDHPNVSSPIHPSVNNSGKDYFVANCDHGGDVPGGYPPTHNLNGATECSCDLDSHIGEYPNCVAAPDLTRAQREGVGTCASQGWNVSTATDAIKCEIPLTSGGADFDGCFFDEGTLLCADVFGETYAFPDGTSPTLVRSLYDSFNAIRSDNAEVRTAARVYRDAVLARYESDPNYLVAPLANIEGNSDNNNLAIVRSVLLPVFSANDMIPFDFVGSGTTDAERLAALPGLITAAFDMIPVRDPYVFNCGAGMIPATVNTVGATECVRQLDLRLRLRLFLEGPLR